MVPGEAVSDVAEPYKALGGLVEPDRGPQHKAFLVLFDRA
jgi:hypothetical protein